jgi:hypothetical protein
MISNVHRKHPTFYALAEIVTVFVSSVLLRAGVDGTTPRLVFSAAILTVTFGVIIVVFTIIIRSFHHRSAYVRTTRDFLVSSFLSTLDHSPLNPAGLSTTSTRIRPDLHQN